MLQKITKVYKVIENEKFKIYKGWWQIIPFYKSLWGRRGSEGNKGSVRIHVFICHTHRELSDFNPTNASGAK